MKKFLLYTLLLIAGLMYGQTYEWSKTFTGGTGNIVYAIATDNANNVYAAGRFNGSVDFDPTSPSGNATAAGGGDLFVVKYASNGAYLWSFQVSNTWSEEAKSIAVDDEGSVYISGGFQTTTDFDPGPDTANLISASSGTRGFIAKYDTNGNYLWAKALTSISEARLFIVVTPQHEIYCTGTFGGTGDFDPGAGTYNLNGSNGNTFLGKYDANGDFVWVKQLGSNNGLEGNSIARDASGNLVVFGNFVNSSDFDPSAATALLTSNGSYDTFLAKYDGDGNYLWAKNIGGADADISRKCLFDNASNIYITGYFQGSTDFDPGSGTAVLTANAVIDIYLGKYDASGNYLWAIGMGANDDDVGYGLATDNASNVYLSGTYQYDVDFDPGTGISLLEGGNNSNTFLAKYDSSGNYKWAYDISCTNNSAGYGLEIDDSGSIVMGGYYSSSADFDFGNATANASSAGGFLAKYSSALLGVTQNDWASFAFYPNPTHDYVELSLAENTPAKISITGVDGKMVKSQALSGQNSRIDLRQLQAGIYLLNLEQQGKTQTKKFIKK